MRVLAFVMLASAVSGFAGGAGVVALFNAVIRAPRSRFPLLLALCVPSVVVFPLRLSEQRLVPLRASSSGCC